MLKPSEPLLQLSNAGVERAGRWLVRGVEFAVCAGEIVTMIGPNGSGKSTTAKMALGIVAPDEGCVSRRSGLVVGYVPQKITIDWTLPLTVERFMRLTGKVAVAEADEAMQATGVVHLRHEEVRTLSGGEFQRVMLARAIARKPDLLVLMGNISCQAVLGKRGITRLRGQWAQAMDLPVLPMFHPAYLLRNPMAKREAWADLLALKARLRDGS